MIHDSYKSTKTKIKVLSKTIYTKKVKRSIEKLRKSTTNEPKKKIAIVFPFEEGNKRCSPNIKALYKRYAKTIFDGKTKLSYHFCPTTNTSQLPNPKKVDGVIISGSPDSVAKPESEAGLEVLISFVQALKDLQIPSVGICFGYQLMAKAFGGTVNQLSDNYLGIKKFEADNKQSFCIYMAHGDGVTELPNGAKKVLQSNENSKHHLLTCFDDKIIGCQGHPEYLDEEVPKRLKLLSGMLSQQKEKTVSTCLEGNSNHKFLNRYISFQLKTP